MHEQLTLDPIPYGFCHCRCGRETLVYRGIPRLYVHGHNRRGAGQDYEVRACGHITPCWVWQLYRNDKGYGVMGDGNGRIRGAHCVYYERLVGPIPEGMQLDHLCRNPPCVNPEHMEPVTSAENQRRGVNTRLSADDIRTIRRLKAEGGVTQRAIARRYDVSEGHISSIVLRRIWRDIE